MITLWSRGAADEHRGDRNEFNLSEKAAQCQTVISVIREVIGSTSARVSGCLSAPSHTLVYV